MADVALPLSPIAGPESGTAFSFAMDIPSKETIMQEFSTEQETPKGSSDIEPIDQQPSAPHEDALAPVTPGSTSQEPVAQDSIVIETIPQPAVEQESTEKEPLPQKHEVSLPSHELPSQEDLCRREAEHLAIANKIMDVLDRYRHAAEALNSETLLRSREVFLPRLMRMIQAGNSIHMVLPAYPFKSPNSIDKVLGTLPDKAEEISLLLLQGMCNSIKDVYSPGASLTIVSDGIVYNDLLGVSDTTVWRYGEALREMAASLSCPSIGFARLSEASHIIDLPKALQGPLNEDKFQMLAPIMREGLVSQFGENNFDVREYVVSHEAARATYQGYIKFLIKDLAHMPVSGDITPGDSSSSGGSGLDIPEAKHPSKSFVRKRARRVAREMITRGKCFAKMIEHIWPESIRLSIHSSNSAHKIAISVLPNSAGKVITTPWHSMVVCRLDGTFVPCRRDELANWDYPLEPVLKDSRLFCYRESSPLYNWPGSRVEFQHIYPCGLMVTALENQSFSEVPMHKLRRLSELSSPVILRGFQGASEEALFMEKGRQMGPIQKWKFGELLRVRDAGSENGGLNNVLSAEPMPMHYDGIFKLANGRPNPPRYQLFTAVTASPKGTGRTLFTPSRLALQFLSNGCDVNKLRNLSWSLQTPAFEATKLENLSFIERHPDGREILRYHEHWPKDRTSFDESVVTVENVSDEEGKNIRDAIETALYDYRACIRVEWEKGDVLVSDNVSMHHTREAFLSNKGRELWRLHVN